MLEEGLVGGEGGFELDGAAEARELRGEGGGDYCHSQRRAQELEKLGILDN